MALPTIGNKTYNIGTPGGTTQSFLHNHNVGANGRLVILIATSNTATITGVTYNGVAMTPVNQVITSVFSTRWEFWELNAPATGSNTLQITFNVGQFNPVSSFVVSFTDCGGIGNVFFDDTAAAPNTGSITVSQDSYVMAALIAGNAVGHNITIDGSSRPLEFTHAINNSTSGAISLGLNAGAISTSVSANTNVTGHYLEIQGIGGGGGRRRALIC